MKTTKKAINEKSYQVTHLRNDIYRKFEKQFIYCFLNPIKIDDSLYVEQSTDEYQKAFDLLLSSFSSDVKFFIGYTGVGKTTFIRHYFSNNTLGIVDYSPNAIVIPISWDGKKISDENYKMESDEQISNVIDNATDYIDKPVEELLLNESEKIIEFIKNNRSDILTSLNLAEILEVEKMGCKIAQFKLQKSKDTFPIECSSSILKYVLLNNNKKHINRVVFVIDDLETLSQPKLCYIVSTFFKVYSCLHNLDKKLIVDLIISLRPHSFRFLKEDTNFCKADAYGNYLLVDYYRLLKNEIPNIKEILINRFEDAMSLTPAPGNPSTWDTAKNVFYGIINDFDENVVELISDLCHLNIRAITDSFQMILSNRVWCQEFDDYTEYPNVRKSDYRFDIVNVIRTLACGENPIYTGKSEMKFDSKNHNNVLSRPSFDGSEVFIPNVLTDIYSKECDILPAIILQYLEGYFSSHTCSPPQTEFITKKELCESLQNLFNDTITPKRISDTIDYIFRNRLIRKSILSKDSDNTINRLSEFDYIYLTRKGSRILSMLENDSVLLEIYREDIKREYRNDYYFKSSLEFISDGNNYMLFEDLINLINEIFLNEDYYLNFIHNNEQNNLYSIDFPVTNRIIKGVEKSINRIQVFNDTERTVLNKKLSQIKERISVRLKEFTGEK